MIKLNKTTVESLEPKASRYEVLDSDLHGFGVRVNPSGKKAYFLKGNFEGSEFRITLDETDFSAARARATKLLQMASDGHDPRVAIRSLHSPVTVSQLADRYFEEFMPKLRPSTRNVYSWVIRSVIVAKLGKMKVGAVDEDVCRDLHASLSDTPRQANMALAILSRLLQCAEAWGYRVGSNPAMAVKKHEQKPRIRSLSSEELSSLIETINRMVASGAANYYALVGIKLIILTGQRKDLIRNLKWSQIDFSTGFVHFPQGRGKSDRLLPLSNSAKLLLESLPSKHGKWVFPASRKAGPIATFDDTWKIVKGSAGLKDVHLNDLRTSYAGKLLSEGVALELVGDLLGTTSPQSLRRYAHLDKLKSAAIDIA